MSTTPKYPSLVMIIRHGEKPGDSGSDKDGGPDLSIAGSARAAALPSLFSPDPLVTPVAKTYQYSCPIGSGTGDDYTGSYTVTTVAAGNPKYPTPNLLIATSASNSSNRPIETVTPLAQYLSNLNNPAYSGVINHHWSDKDYATVATTILGDPTMYGGQTVLICWHHGTAPDLAQALGVPPGQLQPWSPWNPAVFDLIFQITWDAAGTASLAVAYQELLYNDTIPSATHSGSAGAR